MREKRLKRKKQKLLDIHNNMKFNYNKKFNVTIPVPFGFDIRDKSKKLTIREKKLK